MAFENTRLSDLIERGARATKRTSVTLAQLANGFEQRNRNWDQMLHEFDISYGIQSLAQIEEIVGSYAACFGPHVGFLFKDYFDRQVGVVASGAAGKSQIALGDGATQTFQVVRRYTFGSLVHNRDIFKIDEDDVAFRAWINSTELTRQASPGAGQFDVDVTTGLLTTGDTPGGPASGGDGPGGEDVVYGLGYFFVPVRWKDMEFQSRSYLETANESAHDIPRAMLQETRDIA